MPKLSRPRHGSLQFYPRKRIRKFLPRVNWAPIFEKNSLDDGVLGIIGYKVGMTSVLVRDNTNKSMTQGKDVYMPATILEVPNMKIFSVRFYKGGKVLKEIVVSNDKDLKKKVKVSKEVGKLDGIGELNYDDLRVIVYSIPKQTNLKKTPDMIELAVNSSDKLSFVKELVGKEISLQDIMKWKLVDVRGLTRGKGLQGPVKRFGITLKGHKSEKGVRRPGSIGPWHPAHVTFRVPMAGQLGTFSRTHYNLKVLEFGNISEKDINRKSGFKNYGKIKSNYLVLSGSVQGPSKRQILITPAMRPNRKQTAKNYEFKELK